MLNDGIAVQAARNDRSLRGRGITVRKTTGMVIATFCIEGGHTLMHDGRDFDPMVQHLGLQVVQDVRMPSADPRPRHAGMAAAVRRLPRMTTAPAFPQAPSLRLPS